jgi:hypothetical protein
VNPVRDVTGAACRFFKVVTKFSYPVVMEICLGAKFVLAGLCLVHNSNKTSCFRAIWYDPLNDRDEDVVLIVSMTTNVAAKSIALREGFFIASHGA